MKLLSDFQKTEDDFSYLSNKFFLKKKKKICFISFSKNMFNYGSCIEHYTSYTCIINYYLQCSNIYTLIALSQTHHHRRCTYSLKS